MKCPKCNTENKEGFQFCVECGSRLSSTVTCPKCGTEIPADVMFCPNCGLKLQSTQDKKTAKITFDTAKIKTTLNKVVNFIKKLFKWSLCIVAGLAIVLFAVNLLMTESIKNDNGVISFDKYFEKNVDGESQVTHLVFSMDCPDNVGLQKALIKKVFQRETDDSSQMSVVEYIEDYFSMDSFKENTGKEVSGLNRLYKLNFKKNEFLKNVGLDLEMSIKQSFLQENGLACFLLESIEKDENYPYTERQIFFYDTQSNQTLSQENVLDRNIANVIFNIIYDIDSSEESKNLSISDNNLFINADGLEAIKPLSESSQNISYPFKEYPILTKIIKDPYKGIFTSIQNPDEEKAINMLRTFYERFVLGCEVSNASDTTNLANGNITIKKCCTQEVLDRFDKAYLNSYYVGSMEEIISERNERTDSISKENDYWTVDLRTGAQDGYGESYIKEVEYIGNDWYLVDYFDMGKHSARPIKVKTINGIPLITDFKDDYNGFYDDLYDKYYGDSVKPDWW